MDKMTDEEKEAMELLKEFTKIDFSNPLGWTGYYDTDLKELSNAIQKLFNLVEKQQKEIEFYKSINEYKNKRYKHTVKTLKGQIANKDKQIEDMCTNYCPKTAELAKKDKIIDLICECVFRRFTAHLVIEYGIENKEQLKEKFIQYFEKEASKDEKEK